MSSTSWEDLNRRWRELAEQQTEAARGWLDGQGGAKTDAAGLSELWRSWMAMGSLGTGMPTMPGAPGGGTAQDTLAKMLDPVSLSLMGGNQVGEAIRKMTEGPRFADLGATERQMARVTELYLAVQSSARAYEAVIAAAWLEANQLFAARVGERFTSGEQTPASADLLKIWLDIANEVLVRTHRTEGFLGAQRELLRHGMDFLLAERELVEALVEPAGLPTRSELDELHQTVQVLKRKVRQLERSAAGAGTSGGRS